jgi:hypothetical protein
MNAYTAQIIYRIKCEGVIGTEQYEEQWRLIIADDERDALHKTKDAGKQEEATFIDRHGRAIQWEMVAVKDIQPVQLDHGALLFSTIKEVEPVAAPLWAE